ncbi:MAG: hypothetical protein LUQ17_02760 [Methanomicrobiales archaeon]|nr:hypothetical protein [Methanomicrobiales archaeon]
MCPYKRIERCVARYIGPRYRRVVEVGVGANFTAAQYILKRGCRVLCTDIHLGISSPHGLQLIRDDVYQPDEEIYRGAELVYAIRPGVEMVPSLIDLARRIDADLLVYHPGDELFEEGGEVIECGVPLHRYHIRKRI